MVTILWPVPAVQYWTEKKIPLSAFGLSLLGLRETGNRLVFSSVPHYFYDKKEKVQFSFSKFIKSFPNSINPRKVVLLLDKPHETHIVRKTNPRFTKSSNLVFIGRILNEIQRLRNSKIYFRKRVNAH